MDAGSYLNLAKKGLQDAVRGVGALAQTLADESGTLLAGSKVGEGPERGINGSVCGGGAQSEGRS